MLLTVLILLMNQPSSLQVV